MLWEKLIAYFPFIQIEYIYYTTVVVSMRTHCRGNVFTDPLPRNTRLFWLHYSGYQESCHIVQSLKAIVRSGLQEYGDFFFSDVACP
jgi:hypothetical protein